MQVVNPCGLAIYDGSQYAPRHEVYDPAKRDRLADALAARGWQGAPIVADVQTAQAITGSHRIAAARQAGVKEVPAVDIADLADAVGIDLWEYITEGGYADLEDALPHLCADLPAEVVEAYGLDSD